MNLRTNNSYVINVVQGKHKIIRYKNDAQKFIKI